ncbi:MAG: hypothetical protein AAGA35_03620 [Patescibacteria group bacterium]
MNLSETTHTSTPSKPNDHINQQSSATIELYEEGTSGYESVLAFANDSYERDWGSRTAYRPAWFFSVHRLEGVVGCIGLNNRLTSQLFLNDPRVSSWQRQHPERMCDQNFFIARQCSFAGPILLSLAARLAEVKGINYVAYSGIPASQKTLERIGFTTHCLGPVDISIVPTSMQKTLLHWLTANKEAAVYVLATKGSKEYCQATLQRFQRRVMVSKATLQHLDLE